MSSTRSRSMQLSGSSLAAVPCCGSAVAEGERAARCSLSLPLRNCLSRTDSLPAQPSRDVQLPATAGPGAGAEVPAESIRTGERDNSTLGDAMRVLSRVARVACCECRQRRIAKVSLARASCCPQGCSIVRELEPSSADPDSARSACFLSSAASVRSTAGRVHAAGRLWSAACRLWSSSCWLRRATAAMAATPATATVASPASAMARPAGSSALHAAATESRCSSSAGS